MPLTNLQCDETQVSDLSPLQGMPLNTLLCRGIKASSLSPLKGMPLTHLYCNAMQVADLSPLEGMPLTILDCFGTQVSDLTPLITIPTLNSLRVKGTKVTAAGVEAFHKVVPSCGIEWDGGVIPSQPATPTKITNINDPAFQAWLKATQALPAEQQIEAVSKKLMELNPGFDGKLAGNTWRGTPSIVKGVVNEIWFYSDNVTDISPFRALAGLKALICDGSSAGKGKLSDLSPLQGMPLTNWGCNNTQVSDLSPLKTMPFLTHLGFSNTPVPDLSRLAGMSLQSLSFHGTQISDLSPLQGMPLIDVHCTDTKISDLSPLKGMKLKVLDFGTCRNLSDLSPLKGMPLEALNCDSTLVSDLSPLEGMPLKSVGCGGSKVSDLSPLRGMNLTRVIFAPREITKGLDAIRQMSSLQTIRIPPGDEFSPAEFWKKYDAGEFGKPAGPAKLAYFDPAFQQWMKDTRALPAEKQIEAVSKKLMELNPGFDGTANPKIEKGVVVKFGMVTDKVIDISPLRALAGLTALDCSGSQGRQGKLSDLSPLQGMLLTNLQCNNTQISDLSPLQGMQLRILYCAGTPITSLSSLQGMPLTYVACGGTKVSSLSPLQGMPLTYLSCDATLVADLSPIKNCKNLASLNVISTRVTPAAVAALQKVLPNCKIEWDAVPPASPAGEGAKPKTPEPAASGKK